MGAGLSAPGRRPFDFRGKHAFITGGAKGIGLAMAKLLLRRGADVTITDVADAGPALAQLEALAKQRDPPGRVHFAKADVTNYEQMKKTVAEAEQRLGPIDCLVPNAGIASAGMFLDERVEDLERVNRVNFMGVVYTLKAGLPGLVQRRSGCVLMISSLMAMYSGFCSTAYAAPKAAVLALANALRLELIGTGVDITIAMPAFTDTAMRNVGLESRVSPPIAKELTKELPVYTPDVIAELALRGVERGLFFAPSPDAFSRLAVASMAGSAPRVFHAAIELLLLPLYLLMHVLLRRRTDARILRWRLETLGPPPAAAAGKNGSKKPDRAAKGKAQ